MRKICYFTLLSALLWSTYAFAALSQFTGRWKNIDTNTGGITTLEISKANNLVKVRAWGKCSPQDCDWGTVDGYTYAPDVSSNIESSAKAVTATFNPGFSQTLLVIHPNGNNLQVEVLTRFTDNSNRSNYSQVYSFKRDQGLPLTAPKHVSPANGSSFGRFPRTTTLVWSTVQGAASYTVEIDCFGCCQSGKWCTDTGTPFKIVQNVNGTQYQFDFVGAQPGRWRVWAVDSNGNKGPKSAWWEFRYTR